MTPAPSTSESPWQVRDLSQALSGYIDRLGIVWLEAQIAQLTLRHGAHTAYITLRDTVSELSLQAVSLRSVLEGCHPQPQEGDRVIIQGKMEFHPLRGNLQVRINQIRHIGLGQLLARIEQLRGILKAEGLFDPLLKRSLPFLPQTIGLITGKDSAAEKDIIEVAKNRWPGVQLTIINTLVQGAQAPRQIISAVQELDHNPAIDVIIIARGGGSVEDLLPFSDEMLCRAVASATTPIVSAIGHEPDHPLLDEVADLRAATPTDAAKRVVPDVIAEMQILDTAHNRLNNALRHWLIAESRIIQGLAERPIFTTPYNQVLEEKIKEISTLNMSARNSIDRAIEKKYTDIDYLNNQLINLSPLEVLKRGYSIITENNTVLHSIEKLQIGAHINIRLSDGSANATVSDIHPSRAIIADTTESKSEKSFSTNPPKDRKTQQNSSQS